MICEVNKRLSYKNYFLIDKNYDSCQEIEGLGRKEAWRFGIKEVGMDSRSKAGNFCIQSGDSK